MEFKQGILYEVYLTASQSDEGFDVGYFVAKDDKYVVFKCLNVNGFDDGLILIRIENIHKLQFNTKYCISLEKVINHRQTKIELPKFKGKNLISEVLSYAQDNNLIVGIQLNNSEYTDLRGFITDISDEYVITTEADVDGFIDGNGVCKISDIDYMDIDAYKTQKFKILFNINYPNGLPNK